MLRFFSKIRYKFAVENRPAKYLRYAIGEILLVVIGILIALQVNDWNEERKNRILELEYLQQIKIEMQENLKLSNVQINYSNFQIENVNRIFIALTNDTTNSTTEQLLVAIEQVGWDNPVRSIDNVWNELINSGKTRLIHNSLLRDKIVSYHSKMQFLIGVRNEWLSYNMGYRRLVGDVINPKIRENITQYLSPSSFNGSLTGLPNQKIFINKLKNLEGLNGYLADIKMVRSTNIYFFNGIHDLTNEIITLCDVELNK